PELAAFERLRRRFTDEDCLVVAASIDSWWQLRDAQASFPLVADTHALLATAFGAYDQGDARFGWVLLDPTGTVRESDLEDGPCATCALDALRTLLERLGHLEPRRAELLRRAAQHAGARVLGAVDAVPEAHDPLTAVERVPHPPLRVAQLGDCVEHGQDPRGCAAVQRPGQRAD